MPNTSAYRLYGKLQAAGVHVTRRTSGNNAEGNSNSKAHRQMHMSQKTVQKRTYEAGA